jgi:hypothetical protein
MRGRFGRRGRLALLGIVAAALLCEYAAGDLNLGSRAGADPGRTQYQNARRGFSVEYPASWKRAASPMFPLIIEPRSILTVSTFAIPPGRDRGECGLIPSRVRARVGRDGAVVAIYAYHLRGKSLRRFSARPTRFQLDAKHHLSSSYFQSPRGGRTPGADGDEWLFPFRDEGRTFSATVLLGPKASAERRRDAVAVLNSLRVDSRAPGGAR